MRIRRDAHRYRAGARNKPTGVIKRSALLVLALCMGLVRCWPCAARPRAIAQPAASLRQRLPRATRHGAARRERYRRATRQLLDPRRQQVAKDRAFMRRMLFLLGLLLPVLALVSLWQSGRSAMLRERSCGALPNRVAARFVFGAAISTVAALAVLPAALWSYRSPSPTR